MDAPFPYFGGKRTVAAEVWRRLGNVSSFIEPFFGSGAVLLARPDKHEWWDKTETVNDLDGMVSNFWRAVQADAEAIDQYADWPVNENDLHARHAWLVGQKESLQSRLEGNPDYFDAKIAGWWVWGMCAWIGGGFCSGRGPWVQRDGELIKTENKGEGVCRQLVHLGGGRGINHKRVRLGDDGRGLCAPTRQSLIDWFAELQDRLRRVRVCCGDWSRVCTPAAMRSDLPAVGVFLDPPYSKDAGRDMDLYTVDSGTVAHEVREWAILTGADRKYRIALCGYDDFTMPDGWSQYKWTSAGGYGLQGNNAGKENRFRESIWFSPGCQGERQIELL